MIVSQFGCILSILHMITNSSVLIGTHWTLIYDQNPEVLSIQYPCEYDFLILLSTPSYTLMKINNNYSIALYSRISYNDSSVFVLNFYIHRKYIFCFMIFSSVIYFSLKKESVLTRNRVTSSPCHGINGKYVYFERNGK